MVKIYLDAGHGGIDSGARGNGLLEKNLTLTITKKIYNILSDYDVSLKMSRTSDKSLSLKERSDDANNWKADFLLSVHINAGGGTGYEDFIYNGKLNSNTEKIRSIIHHEIVKEIGSGIRNRGMKKANFHMLREPNATCMLTENLFIDTKKDADKLKDNTFLNKIARGHANGIIKAFNLKKKKVDKPSKTKTYYRVVAGSYLKRENANRQLKELNKKGFKNVFIVTHEE